MSLRVYHQRKDYACWPSGREGCARAVKTAADDGSKLNSDRVNMAPRRGPGRQSDYACLMMTHENVDVSVPLDDVMVNETPLLIALMN